MKHVGDRMQDLIRRKSTATLYHGDHGLLAALLQLMDAAYTSFLVGSAC